MNTADPRLNELRRYLANQEKGRNLSFAILAAFVLLVLAFYYKDIIALSFQNIQIREKIIVLFAFFLSLGQTTALLLNSARCKVYLRLLDKTD